MQPRTRRLLIGATLALLALACVAGFGASTASAAKHKTKIRKISSCGQTISKAGTYEVTKNLTDAGGECITLQGNNITLYLDSHTITGTGSDDCIYVEETPDDSTTVNNTIVGGSMKKPSKSATLTGCEYGMYVDTTANTMVSYLKITGVPSHDAGFYAEYTAAMSVSHVTVLLGAQTAYGFELEYGSQNSVTNCTVDNEGSYASFYDEYGVQDSFMHDTSANTYGSPGAGEGFEDYYSSRNNWSHDTSRGQEYGFYLYEDGYGPVTATYDSASYPTTSGSYGFDIYYADQQADSGSPFHTLISHDKSDGFDYGFFDETDTAYYPVAEKWTNNTADNYSEYGFYIYYPTDYTFTGNVADANTSLKHYDGSSSNYGIYLYEPYSDYPFRTFANNEAYDNYWGFYNDDGYMVAGKGNIAKRNEYAAYDVQIDG